MNPINWVKGFFTSTGKEIIQIGADLINDLHTSTDEKMKRKNELKFQVEKAMLEAEVEINRHIENLEQELTERLRIDMSSDSWLSKNVRPLVVGVLTVAIIFLAIFTMLDSSLSISQLKVINMWIPFFTTLMVTVYGFYFGSRGVEKVSKIRVAIAAHKKIALYGATKI